MLTGLTGADYWKRNVQAYLTLDWFIRLSGRRLLKSFGIWPANSAGLSDSGLRSRGKVAHAGNSGIGTGIGPPHDARLRRSRQQYGLAAYNELVRMAEKI